MSAEDANIKVGGQPDDEGGNTATGPGMIAAYVLFAIGAVLVIIVCIWLAFYMRRRRRRKRESQAASPTIIYNGNHARLKTGITTTSSNIKATELQSTSNNTKPLFVETNNNNLLSSPVLVKRPTSENGIVVSGFNTKTKPIAVSTMPRTAYMVDDMVDSPRSVSTKVYAVDDSGIRVHTKKSSASSGINAKKAYVLPVRAVSSERLYTIDRHTKHHNKHRRQHSDSPKVIPVVYASASKKPTSSRLTYHSDPPHGTMTTQSMPTLLRIEPMNLPKRNHHKQQQQQPQLFRVVGAENTTASLQRRHEGSHVENWVERHHAPAPSFHTTHITRDNILYQPDPEDTIDADMEHLRQRTQSLTESNRDALILRWSPSMKRKLELKKQREEAIQNSAGSMPIITKTTTDGITETLTYKRLSEDQLY